MAPIEISVPNAAPGSASERSAEHPVARNLANVFFFIVAAAFAVLFLHDLIIGSQNYG